MQHFLVEDLVHIISLLENHSLLLNHSRNLLKNQLNYCGNLFQQLLQKSVKLLQDQ